MDFLDEVGVHSRLKANKERVLQLPLQNGLGFLVESRLVFLNRRVKKEMTGMVGWGKPDTCGAGSHTPLKWAWFASSLGDCVHVLRWDVIS